MKSLSISLLFSATVLVTGSLCAKADVRPNFDDDAKPILNQQPGLVQYVESKFQVKDTGVAKYPGDDDHAPVPPYIFKARERGSNGPYNVSLLVQPGPPGHILGIVKNSSAPAPQQSAAKAPVPAPQSKPASQAPVVDQPPALTSDTPSGPIGTASSTNATAPAAPSSNAPSLAPPPDPVPQPH